MILLKLVCPVPGCDDGDGQPWCYVEPQLPPQLPTGRVLAARVDVIEDACQAHLAAHGLADWQPNYRKEG